MVTIGLASVSSGELMQAIRRNGLSSGISRNGVVAARVPRLMLRQPAGSDALTPLLEATERTVSGLIPQGGTHDGPLRRWSAWFVDSKLPLSHTFHEHLFVARPPNSLLPSDATRPVLEPFLWCHPRKQNGHTRHLVATKVGAVVFATSERK